MRVAAMQLFRVRSVPTLNQVFNEANISAHYHLLYLLPEVPEQGLTLVWRKCGITRTQATGPKCDVKVQRRPWFCEYVVECNGLRGDAG